MNTQDAAVLSSGQRVALAVAPFQAEINDFAPLKTADDERAALVAALEEKEAAQSSRTEDATTGKETARETMARAGEVLSLRAQAYALAAKRLDLKQAFTLSYTDLRHGDPTEDVNHLRELAQKVQALPAEVRQQYRITDAVVQAALDAATAFEQADDAQTDAKAAPRLATLAVPELVRRLGAALRLMDTLIKGQRTDPNPRWAELYAAFVDANKRRRGASARRAAGGPRIVRTLQLRQPAGGAAVRLANTNYGPRYTLTVENRAAAPLRLWMAHKDGAATTPQSCPAGQITELTREKLGPDTARYLMAQFEGAQGGEATVVVRRVMGGEAQ